MLNKIINILYLNAHYLHDENGVYKNLVACIYNHYIKDNGCFFVHCFYNGQLHFGGKLIYCTRRTTITQAKTVGG